jgi:hypothetical protein
MPGYAPTSAPRSSMPTTANLPQPRDVAMPDFTSNVYVPFTGSLTGNINLAANMLAAWAPRETRFVLRGGYVQIVCGTSCAGTANSAVLSFYDELAAQPILPITTYNGTGTLINWVNSVTPWHFDLGKGYKSQGKNNRLLIGGTLAIGAGLFYCTGLLWGVQEL